MARVCLVMACIEASSASPWPRLKNPCVLLKCKLSALVKLRASSKGGNLPLALLPQEEGYARNRREFWICTS